MKTIWVFIILFFVSVAIGRADTLQRPNWLSKLPQSHEYNYFLGIGEKGSDETANMMLAMQSAIRQMVRYSGGIIVATETIQSETAKDETFESKSTQESDLIVVRGLVLVSIYRESDKVFALYRIEKTRLKVIQRLY